MHLDLRVISSLVAPSRSVTLIVRWPWSRLNAGVAFAAPGRGRGTRPFAERRGDRPAVRPADHQLDGRDLDRRRGPHCLCPGGHPGHEENPDWRAEFRRVARGESLQLSRGHHRLAPGRADLLAVCDHLHLHPRRQLAEPVSRDRLDGMGPPDAGGLPARGALLPRRQRRRQSHPGDGARLLRGLDRLGPSGTRAGRLSQGAVRAERARAAARCGCS